MASMILLLLPLGNIYFLYATLFLLLVLAGIGLPLPEEIVLLIGGYLSYLEFTDYWITVWVLIVGILVSDNLGYLLGRFAGEWVEERISHLKHVKFVLEKAERYFKRHGEKVIFLSRPLTGIRVMVPILAGHFRMKFVKFILYDIFAAVPWTFLLVTASFYLGSGLDLFTEVREVKHTVYLVLAVGIIFFAALRFIREKESAGSADR